MSADFLLQRDILEQFDMTEILQKQASLIPSLFLSNLLNSFGWSDRKCVDLKYHKYCSKRQGSDQGLIYSSKIRHIKEKVYVSQKHN
jgi:hypothetical protein